MLGRRIFDARKSQGRSRVWVACQAGIVPETLKLIESGATANPGIAQVLAIARALNIPLSALVGYDDDPQPRGMSAHARDNISDKPMHHHRDIGKNDGEVFPISRR